VRRLTSLFNEAKFSPHAIDEMMREEAIAALAEIREDLRLAAHNRDVAAQAAGDHELAARS
jgi:hypothetical protein